MRILAIETACAACSVAAWDGTAPRPLRAHRWRLLGQGHAAALLPMVAEVMTEAGWDYGRLDRIAVTVGPGGFTGVRIGLAAARGIGLAAGKPVAGVSTLAALAAGMSTLQGSAILAAIDSKRGDVYVQAFASTDDGVEPCAAPWVAAASGVWTALPDGRRSWIVVGDAAVAVAAALQRRGIAAEASAPEQPDAAVVASLAAHAAIQPGAPPPRPIYLRPPDVSAPAADGSAALLRIR